MQKLTENYVSSNAKTKAALGVDKMPVDAKIVSESFVKFGYSWRDYEILLTDQPGEKGKYHYSAFAHTE